jgi:hypothetical protein
MKRVLVNVYTVAATLCFLMMALPTFTYGEPKNPPLNVDVVNTPSVNVTTLPPVKISGTVPVFGSVNVVNTPSVSISGTVPITGPAKEIVSFSFILEQDGKATITFTNPATVDTVFVFCNLGNITPYSLLLDAYASTPSTVTVTGAEQKVFLQPYILGPIPNNFTAAYPLNVPVGEKLDVLWSASGQGSCNVNVVFHY